MSEAPIGTDRVELTEDERERIIDEFTEGRNPWDFVAVVESIVAARVHSENQRLLAVMDREMDKLQTACSQRDAARAELAAANARCAELENWLTRGDDEVRDELNALRARVDEMNDALDRERAELRSTPTFEAAVYEEAAKYHQTACSYQSERDALQATLDRVTALADEADRSERHINGYGYVLLRALRAALTPEGTE